jgi:Bacterial Ig-like domain
VAAALTSAIAAAACGGQPPEIVDYSPQRNSVDVSTAAPIRITFDHPVDKASVVSRLHLMPTTAGQVGWTSDRSLVYEHATLRTSTTYQVIIESGYRDLHGNVYTLRHHWSFVTEGAPSLATSNPAPGDTGVDPSSYLTLDFSRAMDQQSLKSAIAITPSTPFDVRLDPSDPRRAIIAPSHLLDPKSTYKLQVTIAATDVDGNQLARDRAIDFETSGVRPLHDWIAFTAATPDGSSSSLWIVNESGFPRKIFAGTSVKSFSWSPDGASLVVQGTDESWWRYVPGGDATALSFKAAWAGALAGDLGYAYIDDHDVLHRLDAGGVDTVVAGDVAEAAVAPNGLRLAFVHKVADASQIWGYDVALRATYLLVDDTAPVSGLAWDPTGKHLAYLRHDASAIALRVRSLTGTATTTTVSSGAIEQPAWLPDSTHIVFSAGIVTPAGAEKKAFVVNVISPPPALAAAAALPADPSIDVASPVASPDGHQIAFLSANQVWLMNADGTRPMALTKEDASFPYSCRALAWTRS